MYLHISSFGKYAPLWLRLPWCKAGTHAGFNPDLKSDDLDGGSKDMSFITDRRPQVGG